MELKYAVLSSNSNPEYLDFWPYVAKAWKERIGIKPVLFYIDPNPPSEELKNHGDVYYFRSIPEWDIVQQAQSIRLWASKVIDDAFIISDMDMLPISKEYYHKGLDGLKNGITSYSSDIIKYRWYRTNPQYPMCYLAGDPESFTQIMGLDRFGTHEEFLRHLRSMNLRFGTDQKFFYNQSQLHPEIPMRHLERGWIEEKYATGRLDKVVWPKNDYNIDEYIDCHLPRPLSGNQDRCMELFEKMKLN